MSYLLAAGCSWTDARFKSMILPNYDCSFEKWPTLLGKKLNIPKVINVGESGASNDFIFNRCYDQMAEKLPKIVCVLISSWSRHSIFNYNFNIYDLLSTDYLISKDKLPIEFDAWREWVKDESAALSMAKYLWARELRLKDIVNHTLREIWAFQTFCKYHNIECIIMSGLEPIPTWGTWLDPFWKDDTLALDMQLKDITSYMKYILKSKYSHNIDEKTLLGWPFFEQIGGYSVLNLFESMYTGNQFYIDPDLDGHPNALGHELIADIFYKGYQEIYGKIS
jgi:hypothetical protein